MEYDYGEFFKDSDYTEIEDTELQRLRDQEEVLDHIVYDIKAMIDDKEYKPTKEQLNEDLKWILGDLYEN